jgi:hypothetical protein
MSDIHRADVPGHADATAGDHHDPTDHGGDHGHDDHAHADDALGPIDAGAWGAGALGVAIAIIIAACFALATIGLG